jgi:hypothetical protein
VPKGGATSPVPEQRPDRKACSLNTVYHSPPPEPTDSFTVFSDWGRAERRRHHPVTRSRGQTGKAYSSQVLTVTNPMNIASRLIDGNAHGYAVGIYKSHEISWYYRGRRTTYLGLISLSGCQPPRHIATRLIDGNVRIQKRLAQVRSSIKLVKCPVTCHAGSRGVMSRSQFTWDFPSPNSAVGLLPPSGALTFKYGPILRPSSISTDVYPSRNARTCTGRTPRSSSTQVRLPDSPASLSCAEVA